MTVRIFLVDDHQLFRQGLRRLLDGTPGYRIVGEAGDGRSAIAAVNEAAPDIVLMDISMPELNGIDATRQILTQLPHTRVAALSMYADRSFVHDILRAGAMGYILKESAYEELLTALQMIMNGQVYVSQKIAGQVLRDFVQRTWEENKRPSMRLSGREREVWQLLAEGDTTHEIAARLNIGIRTVESHRQRLMDKLGARSIAELVRMAIKEGIATV